MSKDDCGNHGKKCKLHRRIFAWVLLGFVLLILLTILIIWLALRPTKPKFYLQDATVYQLNLTSSPNTLTTTLLITVSSRNPNARVGIYYDALDVYAAYHDQKVTIPTSIPRGYQGHNDVMVWSPYLYGSSVTVAPYVAAAMMRDEGAGYLMMHVMMEGRIRWKVGSWTSGSYHIEVRCPAFLTVGGGGGGSASPSGFRFQQISSCSVNV